MLSQVQQVLTQRGWFDTTVPYQMSVHLTQGACVWLLLSRNGVVDTHVKFSNSINLHDEALRCAAAHAGYPALAPRFVGHANVDALHLLVSRAVDFQGADSAFLLDPDPRRGAAAAIEAYFAAMPHIPAPAGLAASASADLVSAMQAYFGTHPLSSLAQAWLADGLPDSLRRLPPMAQHGDLVLNNLGKSRAGDLVIFDWEDFGAVSVPGLDLFTLELALAGDVHLLLAGRRQPAAPLGRLVQRCCAAMGLELDVYRRLAPFYALVFRYLKRNYGPAVRARMDGLLQQFDAEGQPAGGRR